jgi:hypothetical protein
MNFIGPARAFDPPFDGTMSLSSYEKHRLTSGILQIALSFTTGTDTGEPENESI